MMKKFLIASFAIVVVGACCSLGLAADRNAEGFKKLDADSDGKVTLAEFSKDVEDKDAATADFKKLDKNSDSHLTSAEFTAK